VSARGGRRKPPCAPDTAQAHCGPRPPQAPGGQCSVGAGRHALGPGFGRRSDLGAHGACAPWTLRGMIGLSRTHSPGCELHRFGRHSIMKAAEAVLPRRDLTSGRL